MNFYFFQWPSKVGGADTRIRDLMLLLLEEKKHRIICVPNDDGWYKSDNMTRMFFESKGVVFKLPEKLKNYKAKPEDIAVSCCNFNLFTEWHRIQQIKDCGFKFIWMNDMMWHSPEEMKAVKEGYIDAILYTSEFHYMRIGGDVKKTNPSVKNFKIDNYFSPINHKFIKREAKSVFTIGKHSRPDWAKYSENFPLFYEDLGLQNAKFLVMGWGDNQKEKWKWHKFDKSKWSVLPTDNMPVYDFLGKLDTYVYNSHYKFVENQSRAIVEAAMSGLPIVAPNRYNFPTQIFHERTGFLWDSYEQCQAYCRFLEKDPIERLKMGDRASRLAFEIWCDKEKQLRQWDDVLSEVLK